MARSPATLDPFAAISEPRRRDILRTLATQGPLPVNDLVVSLGWPQPTVSKHLAILRTAGLVGVSRLGRQRVYRLNAESLKPVHDWANFFEQFWTHQLQRLKELVESDKPIPSQAHIKPPSNPETPDANDDI